MPAPAPNPMALAAAASRRALVGVAGSPVTYYRGSDAVAVLATVGRAVTGNRDDYGLSVRTESRDYLIDAAALVIGGQAVEPRGGDRIVEGNPQTGAAFEVMELPGEPCWRYSDPQRTVIRLHTKYVGPMTPDDA
ncbi:MAG: hypothetical protein JWO31_892 [Phycisphaerales bacterium]|nr:hypothetical protein [Phycisphaerales bacterium]